MFVLLEKGGKCNQSNFREMGWLRAETNAGAASDKVPKVTLFGALWVKGGSSRARRGFSLF